MSKKKLVKVEVDLEYWVGEEVAGSVYRNAPVDPIHTNELVIGFRTASDLRRLGAEAERPQVHLVGTPRALEAFAKYLLGVARLQTLDPDFHDHVDDIRNDEGGTVDLIIRRVLA